jgi:predicted ATPase/DNA-binding winged helix-turn-helix (wHTH) protein
MAELEYGIGRFRLQPGRWLLDNGAPIEIGSKALEILSALVEAHGDLVTKEQLMARAWPDVVVEENAIHVHVSALRRALGAEGHRIRSVRGRGYRFLVPFEMPGKAPPAVPGNLPCELTELIGRETELAELSRLTAKQRLVTLCGAGGIGKTRLAQRLGRQLSDAFPDGVWFVPLEHLARPELVAETIARTFGLSAPGMDLPADRVVTFLRRMSLLLILDNAEHLIAEVARLGTAILANAPAVTLLITSREALGVPGERVYRVPGLGLPPADLGTDAESVARYPAVRLFLDRAEAAAERIELTDQALHSAVEICRRLDGIPLAIELAAARIRLLPPAALLAALEDRFAVLSAGNRAALPRHQTLRATLDWSHDLLSEPERVLLRRLAIFGGSFSFGSVAEIAVGGPLQAAQLFDLLANLVDKSLVVPLGAHAGPRRFKLPESTRVYGRERLAASGESDLVCRLAGYLIRHYEAASDRYNTTPTEAWLADAEPELDNLRTALHWAFGPGGMPALGVELVAHTREVWLELSLAPERRRWSELALAHLGEATPARVRARVLSGLIGASSDYGDRRNLAPALEAASLFAASGEPLRQAYALMQAANAAERPGDVSEAESYLIEAEALLRPLGQTKILAQALCSRAIARAFAGDMQGAVAYFEASLETARATGFRRYIETIAGNLAEIACEEGRLDEALRRAREVEASCRESRNYPILATACQNIAGYLLLMGEVEPGCKAAREALRLHLAYGYRVGAAICIEHLALGAALQGHFVASARLAGYGAAFYSSEGRSREFTESAVWNALTTRLDAALPAERLAALMAEGANSSEDEIAAQALAEDKAARPQA